MNNFTYKNNYENNSTIKNLLITTALTAGILGVTYAGYYYSGSVQAADFTGETMPDSADVNGNAPNWLDDKYVTEEFIKDNKEHWQTDFEKANKDLQGNSISAIPCAAGKSCFKNELQDNKDKIFSYLHDVAWFPNPMIIYNAFAANESIIRFMSSAINLPENKLASYRTSLGEITISGGFVNNFYGETSISNPFSKAESSMEGMPLDGNTKSFGIQGTYDVSSFKFGPVDNLKIGLLYIYTDSGSQGMKTEKEYIKWSSNQSNIKQHTFGALANGSLFDFIPYSRNSNFWVSAAYGSATLNSTRHVSIKSGQRTVSGELEPGEFDLYAVRNSNTGELEKWMAVNKGYSFQHAEVVQNDQHHVVEEEVYVPALNIVSHSGANDNFAIQRESLDNTLGHSIIKESGLELNQLLLDYANSLAEKEALRADQHVMLLDIAQDKRIVEELNRSIAKLDDIYKVRNLESVLAAREKELQEKISEYNVKREEADKVKRQFDRAYGYFVVINPRPEYSQEDKNEARSNQARLYTQWQKLLPELQDYRARVEEIDSEVGKLQDEFNAIEETRKNLEADKTRFVERLQLKEDKLAQKKAEFDRLWEGLGILVKQIDAKKNKNRIDVIALNRLKDSRNELETEKLRLEDEFDKKHSNIKRIESRLYELDRDLELSKTTVSGPEYEEIRAEIVRLGQERTNLEAELDEARDAQRQAYVRYNRIREFLVASPQEQQRLIEEYGKPYDEMDKVKAIEIHARAAANKDKVEKDLLEKLNEYETARLKGEEVSRGLAKSSPKKIQEKIGRKQEKLKKVRGELVELEHELESVVEKLAVANTNIADFLEANAGLEKVDHSFPGEGEQVAEDGEQNDEGKPIHDVKEGQIVAVAGQRLSGREVTIKSDDIKASALYISGGFNTTFDLFDNVLYQNDKISISPFINVHLTKYWIADFSESRPDNTETAETFLGNLFAQKHEKADFYRLSARLAVPFQYSWNSEGFDLHTSIYPMVDFKYDNGFVKYSISPVDRSDFDVVRVRTGSNFITPGLGLRFIMDIDDVSLSFEYEGIFEESNILHGVTFGVGFTL